MKNWFWACTAVLFTGAAALITMATHSSRGGSPATGVLPRRPQTTQAASSARSETASDTPPPSPYCAGIVAGLPAHIDGLEKFLPDWVKLEALLVSHPESVLQALLDRYAREQDPVYKGILTILLACDQSTHDLILADLQGPIARENDLFRAFALLALVRHRRPAELVNSGWTIQEWENLVAHVSFERNPPFPGAARPSWWMVEGSTNKKVQELLDRWSQTEVPWIQTLVEQATSGSARQDSEFAGLLLRKHLNSENPDVALKGLSWLGSVTLRDEDLGLLISTVHQSLDQPSLLVDAIQIIAYQKNALAESALRSLYSRLGSQVEVRARLLRSMAYPPHHPYRDLALQCLDDPEPSVRREALYLLSNADPEAAKGRLADALLYDSCPDVRRHVIWIIGLRKARGGPGVVSTREADALKKAMAEDVDSGVRTAARNSFVERRLVFKDNDDGTWTVVEE